PPTTVGRVVSVLDNKDGTARGNDLNLFQLIHSEMCEKTTRSFFSESVSPTTTDSDNTTADIMTTTE
ncbi:hypothetical protein M9458_055573, partial [Cirrhinus mrigala]